MTKQEALAVVHKLKEIFTVHNLHFTVEEHNAPDLKFIKIKEISIKVDKYKPLN